MVSTFIQLYEFLRTHPDESIISWLSKPWVGKDKQESLLRLFAGLGLLPALDDYIICNGNFNLRTIQPMTTKRDIFYDGSTPISLKDKGDSSDLTAVHKNNNHHILATTSKNLSRINVDKLDIDKIYTNFQQYANDGYVMTLCICVRSVASYKKMMSNIEITSRPVIDLMVANRAGTIVIDWADLDHAYRLFKTIYVGRPVETLFEQPRPPLRLRMHQMIGVNKTMRIKRAGRVTALWGHVPRSGKSYIMAGSIIADAGTNYLIITTAPNETIQQYMDVLSCLQLTDYTIHHVSSKNMSPTLSAKNIIICSKQYLQNKTVQWIADMTFDMRFVDESHNGGTTDIAKASLSSHGHGSFTVQITATYTKPVRDYSIPRDQWVLWDLEDIKLCKTITQEASRTRLVEKHGDDMADILRHYTMSVIEEEYAQYPDMWIMTDHLHPEVIDVARGGQYGWSPDACFLLREDGSFQNEAEAVNVWWRIFGRPNQYGIPHADYPDATVFMKRIQKVCIHHPSRFIGDVDEPTIVMAFLPQTNIDALSTATTRLLEKYNVVPTYEIVSINSKITSDPKQTILDASVRAKSAGKHGVLVLSGRQCSLGVTLPHCDVVLMMNSTRSFDLVYQMMFRCMSEGNGKKMGFIVDLNIQRVVETSIIEYATTVRPDMHPRDAVQYLLTQRLITVNGDKWNPKYGRGNVTLPQLCDTVYKMFSANVEGALHHMLERLRFKCVLLSRDEMAVFNAIFHNTQPTRDQLDKIEAIMDYSDALASNIGTGVERERVVVEPVETVATYEPKINYMDMLRHIVPLVCLLTIHDESTSFDAMYDIIKNDPNIFTILIDQTRTWWGKEMDADMMNLFITLYLKYVRNDVETRQIISMVKELFMKNVHNSEQLASLIDTYLVPHDIEKKSHAEVSTPRTLRTEMLDTITAHVDPDFWRRPRRVLEPCAGKGGFLLDIVARFMVGLADYEPDADRRYRLIVEECLWWGDINPTNVFICRLLLDPHGQYRLNVTTGDALAVPPTIWSGFDAVIGNPPYQSTSNNKGRGNTLWDKFVVAGMRWARDGGYIVFVHPRGWRQVGNKTGATMRQKQLVYLNMNDLKKGQKMFGCATDYDYYLMENRPAYKPTIICDYHGHTSAIDLTQLEFVPNHSIDAVINLMDPANPCGFFCDKSKYETRKQWMSKTETPDFKYPCVYSTNIQLSLRWSNRNDRGHFGVSKFIVSNGPKYIKDRDGHYGLTEWACALPCDADDMDDVEQAFNSSALQSIFDAVRLTLFKYNYSIIRLFKHDFWREFVTAD